MDQSKPGFNSSLLLAMWQQNFQVTLVLKRLKKAINEFQCLQQTIGRPFSKKQQVEFFFECKDGQFGDATIEQALQTGEGQTFWMKSSRNQSKWGCCYRDGFGKRSKVLKVNFINNR